MAHDLSNEHPSSLAALHATSRLQQYSATNQLPTSSTSSDEALMRSLLNEEAHHNPDDISMAGVGLSNKVGSSGVQHQPASRPTALLTQQSAAVEGFQNVRNIGGATSTPVISTGVIDVSMQSNSLRPQDNSPAEPSEFLGMVDEDDGRGHSVELGEAHSTIRHGESSSPSNTGPIDEAAMATPLSPPSICLCQQPTRIPRPRNAFILFRQQHHAAVVAANPGKPNPEISKIIGEMWRQSPVDEKAIWQSHAEEEKKQHLVRFPEYRYQPRRNGKKNTSLGAGAVPSADAFCQTCGGRTGTFSVPNTPAWPQTPMTPQMMRPPRTAGSETPAAVHRRSIPVQATPTPTTAKTPMLQPAPAKKSRTGVSLEESHAGVDALLSLGIAEKGDYEEVTIDSLSNVKTARPHLPSTPQSAKRRKMNNGMIVQTQTLPDLPEEMIDPTLREYSSRTSHGEAFHRPQHNQGTPSRTPYLYHNAASVAPVLQQGHHLQSPQYHPKDVLLAPLDKLRALNKISAPLPASPSRSSTSPVDTNTTRGVIVAIEGEKGAVERLCVGLKENLNDDDNIEIFNAPDFAMPAPSLSELTGQNGHREQNTRQSNPVIQALEAAAYLRFVAEWLQRSEEIVARVRPSDSSDADASDPSTQFPHKKMIIISRYLLSRVDAACAIMSHPPGYTAQQNWQYCATAWRGCVGPDVTILVKANSPSDMPGASGVEVIETGKILLVRAPKTGTVEWEGGIVRRVAFEVGERSRVVKGLSI